LDFDLRTEELSLRKEAQRVQVEAALEQVQQSCGTTANPDKLLEWLTGTKDLSGIRAEVSCTTDANCNSGRTCVAGTCILDFSNPLVVLIANLGVDPEFTRLYECLSPATVED